MAPSPPDVCRFAPSTTGQAHLGTLTAALLCWLDARARGARLLLRLEDLDPDRCRPEHARSILDDLTWLGLDWDATVEQRALAPQHEAALDHLAAQGALYPCTASREDLRALGRRAPDGGFAYDNRSRGRPLPPGGWRASRDPLRVALPAGTFSPADEGGLDLSQDPSLALGDPVVRRRDGAIAYQLAVVVDDAAAHVTRIVRGRDIAPSTATQAALQTLLGLPTPRYRHHLLLLEARGGKLAKTHLSPRGATLGLTAPRLCGQLAWCVGLLPEPEDCTPADLLRTFDWTRVTPVDQVVSWQDGKLHATPADG
ncbi:glutamate--tRNA ligase family protein [Chondromyces apiculatus]|uniref:Glutamyl-Q-tRNA synthetase n=1 Tax=Chondromyces apiculatus DSM 436 TaxID=1192034 RepID=A0A017T5D3_9BACT|nr:glutamate--tRNA ligase family protein [Chondromyces apiculatus]EYF03776.1 glutamyl-Q-tRNA synthetase [Chondromyces apiculatus DSM 436]